MYESQSIVVGVSALLPLLPLPPFPFPTPFPPKQRISALCPYRTASCLCSPHHTQKDTHRLTCTTRARAQDVLPARHFQCRA